MGLCSLSLTIKLTIKCCRAELYILFVHTMLPTGYLVVFISILKKENTKKIYCVKADEMHVSFMF